MRNVKKTKNWIDFKKPIIPQLESKSRKGGADFYYNHWVYKVKTKKQVILFSGDESNAVTVLSASLHFFILLIVVSICYASMGDVLINHTMEMLFSVLDICIMASIGDLSGIQFPVVMTLFHFGIGSVLFTLYISGFVFHMAMDYLIHLLFHTRVFPITFHFAMHGVHHVAPFSSTYIPPENFFIGVVDLVLSFIFITCGSVFFRVVLFYFPILGKLSNTLHSFPYVFVAGMISSSLLSYLMIYYSRVSGTEDMERPLMKAFDLLTKSFREEKDYYVQLYKHHQNGLISQFVPIGAVSLFAKFIDKKMV